MVGLFAFTLFAINTVVLCLVVYFLAALRFLCPVRKGKALFTHCISRIAELWISINGFVLDKTQNITWDSSIDSSLDPKASYLVISNHQSWIDILVLQKTLNLKIPLLRFFIKQELFWFPFLGLAWWALDFPFMRRYSKSYLAKNPHKRRKDIETTRKRCERFLNNPTSILIFAEGTRYTPQKKIDRDSPFQHLLPPKSGGVSNVLDVMGGQFVAALDVTIVYPEGVKRFWDFLSRRVSKVIINVRKVAIPKACLSNSLSNKEKYRHTKTWLTQLWVNKDQLIQTSLDPHSTTKDKQPISMAFEALEF